MILGMTLGAIDFYFTDSTLWPLIHTVPFWKMVEQVHIGITRTIYPFFAGLLLSRIAKPARIKHAF